MKIILLTHVKNLGQKGEVKEVPEGYFHNFLAPRKLAVPATEKQIHHIHAQQEKAVERLVNMKESANAVKARVEGKVVLLNEKASETGHLYAAVHINEIVHALKEQLGVEVPEKNIQTETIKNVGDFQISVQLFKDTQATLTLQVRAA